MNEVPPDDVPQSPTGRVPDWVKRQAAGEVVGPVPFRAAPDGPRRSRRPRMGSVLRGVLVLCGVTALLSAYVFYYGISLPWVGAGSADAGTAAPAWPPAGPEGPRPAGLPSTPPVPPESSSYGFIATQQDGVTPVLWSPCRPIHWVVRPDNMPIGAQKLVTDALAEVSRLSGLTFEYDGETTETPSSERVPYQPDRYGERWAPLLIAWVTATEVPDFGDDVLADGGAQSVPTPSGDDALVSGQVRLDAAKMDDAIIAKRIDLVHSVLLHELGHVVGLDHVSDSKQLMYPEAQLTLTELGTGDIDGFGFAGQGACQPDV